MRTSHTELWLGTSISLPYKCLFSPSFFPERIRKNRSEAAANMLARRGMQNRLAVPADRRIPLTPAEVQYTNQLLGK